MLSTLSIFCIPDDSSPLIYVRYLFGALLILWLPGYSLTRALFPKKNLLKKSSEALVFLERFILSIILSIILVSLVTLLLNYTFWGIRLTSVTLSLSALTVILATFALAEECKSKS